MTKIRGNMNNMLDIFLSVAIVILFYMTGWFLLASLTKRNDLADIAWGLGFIVVVYYLYTLSQNNSPQFSLILLLTTLWGISSGHAYLSPLHQKVGGYSIRRDEKRLGQMVLPSYLPSSIYSSGFSDAPHFRLGHYGFSKLHRLVTLAKRSWGCHLVYRIFL